MSDILKAGFLTLGGSVLILAVQFVLLALSIGDGPSPFGPPGSLGAQLAAEFIMDSLIAYPALVVGAGLTVVGLIQILLKRR